MKASELAKVLLSLPDIEVAVRKHGSNAWPVDVVTIEEWDDGTDSSLLVDDPSEGGAFLLIDAGDKPRKR